MSEPQRKKNADAARKAAALAVMRLYEGGFANLVAGGVMDAAGLEGRDRAFGAALFYGTAERLGTLDALLGPWLKQPIEKLDAEVRAVLETGLYQILYMDIPPRAAVDEAVTLVRAMKKSSAAGLVNAVLRRAGGMDVNKLEFANERERVQAVWSVSGEVADAVMNALPDEYDEFFAASFAKQEQCLRANRLRITPDSLTERLRERGVAARAAEPEGCVYAGMPGRAASWPLFEQGLYHVQGEASQWACACVDAQPGMRVLDLCAAPGGKAATLAQQMGSGAGLTACDVKQGRVALIRESFARLGIEGARVFAADATKFDEELLGQDRVLCDVPCSGLGVLASKPDIRYVTGENFFELPNLQLAILSNGARYVKRGGRLVYSTCTVRPQENEQVVGAFLEKNPEFVLATPKAKPDGARMKNEMMTILPHLTGLDGFFVATMERL